MERQQSRSATRSSWWARAQSSLMHDLTRAQPVRTRISLRSQPVRTRISLPSFHEWRA